MSRRETVKENVARWEREAPIRAQLAKERASEDAPTTPSLPPLDDLIQLTPTRQYDPGFWFRDPPPRRSEGGSLNPFSGRREP